MNKIIVNGRSLAGKDTVAGYLVEKYGFTKIAFADLIYDLAREYFGMKNKDRNLLQQIGEKFREIDPDVWVKYAVKKIEKYEKCIISDCRRINEYKYFTKLGFIPIRVHADLDKRIERAIKRDGEYPDISLWENKSETGADNCWYIEIDNNGDFNHLYKQIDNLMGGKYSDLYSLQSKTT